jgi:putative oxygen-independent coproporphyrinogen III oxidase
VPSQLPLGKPWPKAGFVAQPESSAATLHAYVHIPFCEVRCGYCDFNTYTASELGDVTRTNFDAALESEIHWAADQLAEAGFQPRPMQTVFFGGGTPTLFNSAQFDRLIQALRSNFGLASEAEITVEANPDTLSAEYLEQLVAVGVNRISIGVQSFDSAVLAVLDRTHDAARVPEVVAMAKTAGLNTSIDLIYGSPGESLESWRATLERALQLETDHLSAYSLIVEPGTALERRIRRGELPAVDDDLHADMYELLSEKAEAAGLEWYEISNWARSKRSEHNLAYWRSMDWWGFGPGAHSHLAGTRWWNTKHPAAYLQKLQTGSPAHGFESLTQRARLEERVLLELRTELGVPLAVLEQLSVPESAVRNVISTGKAKQIGEQLILTAAGRLLADGISLELLSAAID